jgi:hypothetical protein
MRRGCISLGETKCTGCNKTVPVAERYIVVDEVTDETGKKTTAKYCIKCCLEKGLAGYRQEKDEKILTFFPPDEGPMEMKHTEPTEKTEEEGK